MKILVVDDDRETVDLLTYCLRGFGYEIVRAFDGAQALKMWREQRPDLVILDVEMPKLDGFEVCRRMTNESTALVLFLTCHDREADEVHGLDLGADDYLRKPFRPKQLLARIRALARRSGGARLGAMTSSISSGPVALDSMRHEATRSGAKVRLLLLTHSGQVLTTDQIVERVWGYEDAGGTGLVKTHIRHLRQKIEPVPSTPQYIVTVPGVGYTFMAQPFA